MNINVNGKITTIIAEKNKYLTIKDLENVFTETVGHVRRIDCEDLKTTDVIIEKTMK